MQAWLTPDSAPAGTTCIRLEVPAGEDWEAIVRGALVPLFSSFNFEEYGSLTPEETAAAFLAQSDQWMRWEGCLSVGTVLFTAANIKPAFALWCDGSQVAQADYPALYAALGTTWGSADEGNFRLPDMRDKFPVGSVPDTTEEIELADTGGEAEHTLTGAEMPAHNHDISYTADIAQEGVGIPYIALGGVLNWNTSTEGGGDAHNNMPPYVGLNAYIIAR